MGRRSARLSAAAAAAAAGPPAVMAPTPSTASPPEPVASISAAAKKVSTSAKTKTVTFAATVTSPPEAMEVASIPPPAVASTSAAAMALTPSPAVASTSAAAKKPVVRFICKVPDTPNANVPDENGMYPYAHMHRLVLQGMMAAGFLDAKGVKRLFHTACTQLGYDPGPRTTMQGIQNAVRQINDKIKPFDMAIKSASCELTGKKYYVFLITVEKPIMKLQTVFTKSELELFQRVMTDVLRKYETFSIPVIECLNMAKNIESTPRFNLESAQKYFNRMCEMEYFSRFFPDPKKRDYHEITLGFRAIREFEPILREAYDDIVTNCQLCKMLMLHGFQCPKCWLYVHKACYERYTKGPHKLPCPTCQTPWTDKNLIRRTRSVVLTSHEPEKEQEEEMEEESETETEKEPEQEPELVDMGGMGMDIESDHYSMNFDLDLPCPPTPCITVTTPPGSISGRSEYSQSSSSTSSSKRTNDPFMDSVANTSLRRGHRRGREARVSSPSVESIESRMGRMGLRSSSRRVSSSSGEDEDDPMQGPVGEEGSGDEQGPEGSGSESGSGEEGSGEDQEASGEEQSGSGEEQLESGNEQSGDEQEVSGEEEVEGSGEEEEGSAEEQEGSGEEQEGSGEEQESSGEEAEGSGEEQEGSEEEQEQGEEEEGEEESSD